MEPAYQPPVQKTCRKYLEIEYQEKKELVKQLLSKQPSVAVTSDIWTSRKKQGYITVTSHFIDGSWNMRTGVLATKHMPENHTGHNIAERVKNAADLFGIKEIAGIAGKSS